MTFRKFTLNVLMATAAISSLAACGKSDSSNRTNSSNASVIASQLATCANGQSAIGFMYSDSGDLTQQVQALVSASMDPNSFGSVSGNPSDGSRTGIEVRMRLRQVGGQLQASGSMLQLTIYDQYVASGAQSTINPGQTVQPYPITMTQAAQASGMSVVFSDNYGTITVTLTGQDQNGSALYGDISFTNRSGAYAGQNVTLGHFKVPKCVVQ